MRIAFTLARDDGSRDDLVVTAGDGATIGDLARAIAERDPGRSVIARPTLRAEGQEGAEPPSTGLAADWLVPGSVVALVEETARTSSAVATLEVLGGRQRGQTFPLPPGAWIVGRHAGADVRLDDPFASARHARLEVSDRVEVVDLGSANGVLVDGERVARVPIRRERTIVLGATGLRIRMLRTGHAVPSARIAFNRSPRVEPRVRGATLSAPGVPPKGESPPFPWLAAAAPIAVGVAMALVTGRPSALLFVLLTPVALLAGFLANRGRARRQSAATAAAFEARLAALRREIERAFTAERAAREAASPPVTAVVRAVLERSSLLWTRRPEHEGFLAVRLGTGPVRPRTRIAVPVSGAEDPADENAVGMRTRIDALAAQHARIPDAPVVERLQTAGALGCVGPRGRAAPVIAGLLTQLIGLHSPAELVVAAIVSPAWAQELDWLKWLPHASSAGSPLGPRRHLADSPAGAAALLVALEELVAARSPTGPARRGAVDLDGDTVAARASAETAAEAETPVPLPALVVVISADAPAERARIVALGEAGPEAGVFPIWVGDAARELPAVCRTTIETTEPGAGTISFVRYGERIEAARLETVDAGTAARLARSLAPVVDAGALAPEELEPPAEAVLARLLGEELLEAPAAVVARWHEHASIVDRSAARASSGTETNPPSGAIRLDAVVGASAEGPLRLDLRAHGPHALVAGTTGAGKSEFLQAWVLGMAAERSPDRVTFLLVDYKGGSAFADCVALPHCVGLVTDLSPPLARRALASLGAELRRRELLLHRKAAKDLIELERRGDPDAPAALVIVVDEFAALAAEVPEFVDGVVDLAQRGRSLGIHLVLATQRPAGIVKDAVRANTNLRVALRTADPADSLDVVGTGEAAGFDPAVPGRALVRTGPGRPRVFQAAYAGGRTGDGTAQTAEVEVAELRFGSEPAWRPPSPGAELDRGREPGPTDQQRLVATIGAAARLAGVPAPRRPWLDALPPIVDLGPLLTGDDAAIPLGLIDDPATQSRRTALFRPDEDGHLAVHGTGGSGKTVVLRTLALAVAATPTGGPVHVYGLDFAAGGLRLLEALPHVGSIVPGEDAERVRRLLRTLRAELDDRARRYPAVSASSIVEYRRRAGAAGEPRILLLVDGFPAFREEWELASGRAETYEAFKAILGSGRRLGMHLAFTSDRSASVPSGVAAVVPRRIVLRTADDEGPAPSGAHGRLAGDSPPGRAVVDGLEAQIAVLGAAGPISTVADQVAALADHAARHGTRIPVAAPIERLPAELPATGMPSRIDGRPVLGMSDETLALVGFEPSGVLVVAGPPGSGRSNALAWLVRSLRAFDGRRTFVDFGVGRSSLAEDAALARRARSPDEVAGLARELVIGLEGCSAGSLAIVIEGVADLLHTAAEAPLAELVRLARRHGHLVIAENEVGGWSGSWPLLVELKNARRGLLLQPDPIDGETLLRTPLPRSGRGDRLPGRGVYVERGRAIRLQIPHIEPLG